MLSQTIIEVPDAEYVCVVDSFPIILSVSIVAAILALALVSLLLIYKYRGEIKIILYMKFRWHPFDCSDDTDIVGKVCKFVFNVFTMAGDSQTVNLYARRRSLSYWILSHKHFGSLVSSFM